jgi:hypothetical protein
VALNAPPPPEQASQLLRSAQSSPNLAALKKISDSSSLKHLSAGRIHLQDAAKSSSRVPDASIFRSFHSVYEIDTGGLLGTGGYAVVRRATHKQTGKVYAVKIMNIGHSKTKKDEAAQPSHHAGGEDDFFIDDEQSESDDGSKVDMSMSFEVTVNGENVQISPCELLYSSFSFLGRK